MSSTSQTLTLLCIVSVFCLKAVLANDCSILPRSLPLTNYTLGDAVARNRGIFVQIGGEPLGLRISTIINNTRVRNIRDCEEGNATAETGCAGASGSDFDVERSTTWQAAAPRDWNVSTVDPHEGGETVVEGWDQAEFYGTGPIPGFPLEVWSDLASDNKSGLAFGPESSFLDWFLQAGKVPSRVFGIFFGSRSQLQGVDGNVTIGGYDKARVNGPWTNFSMQTQHLDAPCPLQVLIKDIRLNNINGSSSLFLDSDATVAACLDPLQNGFTLTQSMYDRFINLTLQPDLSNSQATYPASAEPLFGNLSITLANGYETTIPHYELVSQERGTDSEGKYTVINASAITVPLSANESVTSEVVPILGGIYLSLNYLLVDYENQVFSLAPAVVGPMGDQDHDIVTVCNGTSSHSGGNGNNIGGIMGAVFGSVIPFVLTPCVVFYLRRRRRLGCCSNVAAKEEHKDAYEFVPQTFGGAAAEPAAVAYEEKPVEVGGFAKAGSWENPVEVRAVERVGEVNGRDFPFEAGGREWSC
ncbi:hypothetical protein MMC12_007486 [Toensbergia leucococca]|nr:hypothetical protein [Toensbergia leucococca]